MNAWPGKPPGLLLLRGVRRALAPMRSTELRRHVGEMTRRKPAGTAKWLIGTQLSGRETIVERELAPIAQVGLAVRVEPDSGYCLRYTKRYHEQEQEDRRIEREPKPVRPRRRSAGIACEKEQTPYEEHYSCSRNHGKHRSRCNDASRNVYRQRKAGLLQGVLKQRLKQFRSVGAAGQPAAVYVVGREEPMLGEARDAHE